MSHSPPGPPLVSQGPMSIFGPAAVHSPRPRDAESLPPSLFVHLFICLISITEKALENLADYERDSREYETDSRGYERDNSRGGYRNQGDFPTHWLHMSKQPTRTNLT